MRRQLQHVKGLFLLIILFSLAFGGYPLRAREYSPQRTGAHAAFAAGLGEVWGKYDQAGCLKLAELLKPVLASNHEPDRFYAAKALGLHLEGGKYADPKPLTDIAVAALKSPRLKGDNFAWGSIVYLTAPDKVEQLFSEVFPTLGYEARLAVLDLLATTKGPSYSKAPFTKPGQSITAACDALWAE